MPKITVSKANRSAISVRKVESCKEGSDASAASPAAMAVAIVNPSVS